MPSVAAPVALVLTLGTEVPRFVESAGRTTLLGCAVPQLAFDARGSAAAVRAEYALALHGRDVRSSQTQGQPSHRVGT